MQAETLHVVDRAGQTGDFELAAVARSGVDLPDRQRAAQEMLDAAVEGATDFNGIGIAGVQHLGGNPRLPDFREQQHR